MLANKTVGAVATSGRVLTLMIAFAFVVLLNITKYGRHDAIATSECNRQEGFLSPVERRSVGRAERRGVVLMQSKPVAVERVGAPQNRSRVGSLRATKVPHALRVAYVASEDLGINGSNARNSTIPNFIVRHANRVFSFFQVQEDSVTKSFDVETYRYAMLNVTACQQLLVCAFCFLMLGICSLLVSRRNVSRLLVFTPLLERKGLWSLRHLFSFRSEPPKDPSVVAKARVEQLAVTTATYLDRFLVDGMSSKECQLQRLQGKIIAVGNKPLVAPLSSQPCVMYSASVVPWQDSDVPCPPIAYHSAGESFAIQVAGSSNLELHIDSTEVRLVGKPKSLLSVQHPLGHAPEAMRAFCLAHGVSAHSVGGVCNTSGILDFRERALLVGSEVTVVGEVIRDVKGVLRVLPWQPPATTLASTEKHVLGLHKIKQFLFGSNKDSCSACPSFGPDPALGCVLIADDPSLIDDELLPLGA